MGKTYTYSDIISEYSQALQRINELAAAPEDLFLLKPDPGNWSGGEIFRHLRRFNNLYLRKIEHLVRKQYHTHSEKLQFKPKWIPFLAIRFLEPPYKLKIPTLAPMYPKSSNVREMETITEELRETNRMAVSLLEDLESSQADIDRIKGSHPVFKILPMTLTDLFLVMSAHQRRHFWQAEQTLYRLSGTHY